MPGSDVDLARCLVTCCWKWRRRRKVTSFNISVSPSSVRQSPPWVRSRHSSATSWGPYLSGISSSTTCPKPFLDMICSKASLELSKAIPTVFLKSSRMELWFKPKYCLKSISLTESESPVWDREESFAMTVETCEKPQLKIFTQAIASKGSLCFEEWEEASRCQLSFLRNA